MDNSQNNREDIRPRKFDRGWLDLDPELEVYRICTQLRTAIITDLHKQGGVIGISGGIDSSVVLALAVRAIGAERVLGILLPERESDPESSTLAHTLAEHFGVRTITESISDALDGFGCYRRRDDAIRQIVPEYTQPGWAAKIVLPPDLLERDTLNFFSIVVTSPEGVEISRRLPKDQFQQIVAASNFKQRSRMSMLYFHAEANNYAVLGTANKNEHDLGFFVKWGDGGVDFSPILHLFKTQVYQLASFLNIPEEIQRRVPTTDTYPGGSTQEEFFYRIPFDILDTVWLGYEKGIDVEEIAQALNLNAQQVSRVISDIQSKIRSTHYLRTNPLALA